MSVPNDYVKIYNQKLKSGAKFGRKVNGYFVDLQQGQKILFADQKDPGKGILIIQHGIEGKGTIIYSMMRHLPKEIIENLLGKHYGKLQKGVSAAIPVSSNELPLNAGETAKSTENSGGLPNTGLSAIYKTRLPVKSINPLFLRNLEKKAGHILSGNTVSLLLLSANSTNINGGQLLLHTSFLTIYSRKALELLLRMDWMSHARCK